MTVNEKIAKLRELMKKHNMDMYIIPTDDFHQSENVGEYFQARKYMSGFTGSAGIFIVTQEGSFLWADGRYHIQAEKEIAGSEITLFKAGTKGTPTLLEFIYKTLKDGEILGFDGRTLSYEAMANIERITIPKKCKMKTEFDLVGEIWEDRPPMSQAKMFLLDEKYAGESVKSKLERVRKAMKEVGANVHIISALDDINWLFNFRGRDIECAPMVLSYAIITATEATLFVDNNKLNDEIREYFKNNKVEVREYDEFYDALKEIAPTSKALVYFNKINSAIYSSLHKDIVKINKPNPCELFKAIKNDVEIENIKRIHIKDGVIFTKFMYWLKNNYDKEVITELSAANMIDNLRKNSENFVDFSFPTISAFGSNAAMMHYTADENSNARLEKGKFLLVDSGGHYLDGSTDITRTIALGEVSDELKLHFTTVLRSMIALSNTKFLHGCKGYNLDAIARGPVWELGIDYRCGTGHGVGYLLNIHEDPNDFRLTADFVVEKNMITTVEPGIYVEGSHGIRIENEVLSENHILNEYGQFMKFTPVTVAPIDIDGINPDLLSAAEKNYLNNYHKNVFEKLSPYLTVDEREWLKTYTQSL